MSRQSASPRLLRRWQNRRGISIILVGVVLVVLVGFVSLAVDIGRLRLANAQLQTSADAAARAGAYALFTRPDTPATSQDVLNECYSVALDNPTLNNAANGQRADAGVQLNLTKDVHFGFWDVNKLDTDPKKFTEITDIAGTTQDERRGANAVRVEVWRHTARGTPVKMIFAPILGVNTKNAYATATAYITGGNGANFGFVGLRSVSSNGNKATVYGGIASDGTISLGNGDVKNTPAVVGDARPGQMLPGLNPEPSLQQQNNSTVAGWTANLDYQLAPLYPPVLTVPADAQTPIPTSGILQGGTDYAHRLKFNGTIPKHFNMTIKGYVVLYITQSFDLKDIDSITWINPSTPNASRLEIYMTGTAPKVTYVGTYGNTQFYAHIYAPQCDVELGGTADFTGWAIGKSLSFQGNSTFTYDGTNNKSSGSGYKIHLVR